MPTFLKPEGLDDDAQGRSVGVTVAGLVYADASAVDPDTMRRIPEASTVAEETGVCLERLRRTLEQAGCTLSDLVKVTSYLADDSYRAEFWQTYNELVAPGPYPPRLTQVADLDGDARVVLDAVAVIPA